MKASKKTSPATPAKTEHQVPFNPDGPEVVAVPVRVRKPKKAAVPPRVIGIEAATVERKVVAIAATTINHKYTGETSTLNGIPMYEHILEGSSRSRWTIEPPKK